MLRGGVMIAFRRPRLVPGIALIFAIATFGIPNAAARTASAPRRCCTSQWRPVPAPAPYFDGLTDVSAVSDNDVWAVGASGYVSSAGLIEHWDGVAWSVVPFEPVGTNTSFYGVSATAADDAWAVGSVTGLPSSALVEHWNGTKWSAMRTQAGGSFNAVVANSRTDVWALGSGLVGSTIQPFVEHWDGHSWQVVSLPTLPDGGYFNHGASTPSGLWGVGFDSSGQKALAERWDGSRR